MAPEPGFTVRVESRNGVGRVVMAGELDMSTVPTLEEHLAPFEQDSVTSLMLDLRDLTFIDSTGLRAILQAHGQSKANGQTLVVIGATPYARHLFEVTGLEFLLDDQEAVGVLQQFTGSGQTTRAEGGVDADA
jgi:anti-sigma B factor antagonist